MSDKFAVIRISSRQFLVEENNQFKIDRITPKSKLDVLVAQDGKLSIGEPTVSDIGVKIEIVEQKQDKKVSVRRYKSKSRYRKNKGHRQPISVIRIAEIKKGSKNQIVQLKDAEKKETVSKTEAKESKPQVKAADLSSLDITDSMRTKLEEAGYKSVSDIKKAKKEDILAIKGVGEKAVEKLLSQVE